ncbi:MAG: hypothetical protein JKY81_04595 [Colwellia sp.]|nr:hypothetical protein [Colwellia sp.]
MAKTRAQENRAIRQEALREQLAAQGHHQHVIEILDKTAALTGEELTSLELQKNKLIIDTKLALMKKYLPDVKQVELVGEAGAPIELSSSFEFIPVGSDA